MTGIYPDQSYGMEYDRTGNRRRSRCHPGCSAYIHMGFRRRMAILQILRQKDENYDQERVFCLAIELAAQEFGRISRGQEQLFFADGRFDTRNAQQ